jgi:hypothetical protein
MNFLKNCTGFVRQHKVLSFLAVFGTVYVATYPYKEPSLPTSLDRIAERKSERLVVALTLLASEDF